MKTLQQTTAYWEALLSHEFQPNPDDALNRPTVAFIEADPAFDTMPSILEDYFKEESGQDGLRF